MQLLCTPCTSFSHSSECTHGVCPTARYRWPMHATGTPEECQNSHAILVTCDMPACAHGLRQAAAWPHAVRGPPIAMCPTACAPRYIPHPRHEARGVLCQATEDDNAYVVIQNRSQPPIDATQIRVIKFDKTLGSFGGVYGVQWGTNAYVFDAKDSEVPHACCPPLPRPVPMPAQTLRTSCRSCTTRNSASLCPGQHVLQHAQGPPSHCLKTCNAQLVCEFMPALRSALLCLYGAVMCGAMRPTLNWQAAGVSTSCVYHIQRYLRFGRGMCHLFGLWKGSRWEHVAGPRGYHVPHWAMHAMQATCHAGHMQATCMPCRPHAPSLGHAGHMQATCHAGHMHPAAFQVWC